MNFFKKSLCLFIFLISYCFYAQTARVIDNKGTIKEVDNSKWSTSGNNISNKNSGNVGIGGSPDASAKLEVNSITSGFLPPRLTTVQRDAIVLPATGLVVFNLTTNTLEINNGTPVLPAWTSSFTPDATTTTKGILKLAGDLSGTSDLPTVPALANKENTIAAGTTSQYWRGDKTWQTLDKSAVGLGNVDNTADTNKSISTATQTALDTKENAVNKSDVTTLGTSDVLFPTQNAVKTYVDTQINTNATPDATALVKGKIQLAGDLAGTGSTATNPVVTDNAITTSKIADEAVTPVKIASGGISKVLVTDGTGVVAWIDGSAFGAVADMSTIEGAGTTASPFKVKDLGIITAKLDDGAVTTEKIFDATILVDDLANDAVETSKIKDLNVTNGKLANDAVTTSKILNETILNEDIADNTITTGKIAGQIAVSDGGTGSDMSTTTGYVKQAGPGANFTTVTSIPVGDVTGAVIKVNGSLPDSNGNVSVNFGTVTTGNLSSIPLATTPGLVNGDIYVVSGDSNPDNNGLTYIFDGTLWQEVSANQASLDARYLRLAGDTMQGNIVVPATKKITITDAPNTATDAVNKAYVDAQIASGAPDATTSLKGKIQLGGDLAGTGTTAETPVISDNAITNNKINANAVTTIKIADNAVTTIKLADNSVTNAKIAETIIVSNGGTGATSLTGYVKGNGTDPMTANATIPVADVTGAQTLANLSSNITTNTGSISMYPSVAAVEAFVVSNATPDATTTVKGKIQLAGDLAGSADAPSVVKIQGIPVSTTTPTSGQLLQFDGSVWKPVNVNTLFNMETDEIVATAAQVSFSLTTTPIGKIAMYINGVRVPKDAVSVSGTAVTYTNLNNGGYVVLANDRITFDYITN